MDGLGIGGAVVRWEDWWCGKAGELVMELLGGYIHFRSNSRECIDGGEDNGVVGIPLALKETLKGVKGLH